MENKTAAQALILANRLQKRFRHLKKWAQRKRIEAFRLYDKDIPEIPLVLDFYGNPSVPEDAAISGALYKRPYEKDESDEEKWLLAMKESLSTSLEIPLKHIFIKHRQRQKGVLQYQKFSEDHFVKIVNEGELVFKVNLSDYLDTGLFPDRRLLREMVRSEASGKKVLNLFCYTGSFSVYAASGGAVSTDSVDLSNNYLSWARENFSLNGFSAKLLPRMEKTDGLSPNGHKLIRTDVLDFLEKASGKIRWDLIIVDPPAFSNSKKMFTTFDLNRDLTDLLVKCLFLLTPGGKIFVSVNLRRAAPAAAELETILRSRLSEHPANPVYADLRITDLGNKIVDEDFRGKKTPKAYLVCV
ncbi:MAG: class I SAM-dependent methyltransferase [Treponema sp.]|nr:class I SAM-dependent methyltransferase [Treponema sp.]